MYRSIYLLFAIVIVTLTAAARNAAQEPGGMAVSPARFELEMKPGTETTVVVNLDYRALATQAGPARIVASLNDWTITPDGRIEYFRPNSQSNSASSWIVYSPGEAAVTPGVIHPIRVTVSVPPDAAPGDHLTALIVEQRADTIKYNKAEREMIVRYRLASVFYIKVSQLTKKGSFEHLYAEQTNDGVVVTPTFKNSGNSLIRPTASLKIIDADGTLVTDLSDVARLPVLAGAELKAPTIVESQLKPGKYTVKYRVDFQDGSVATEGVTDLVVKPAAPQIATSGTPPKKP